VAAPIPHFISSEMVYVIETPCRISVIAKVRQRASITDVDANLSL
jgi:hypothetical protein